MARTKVELPEFNGVDETFDLELADGEWMPCSCSTKAGIYGPVTITIQRWRDGGILITGEDGHEWERPDE